MKRLPIHWLLVLLLLTAILEPGHADPGPPRFVPGEVLVVFRPDLTPRALSALVPDHGARVVASLPRLGVWRLRVECGHEQAVAKALSTLPQVLYAEPNYRAWAMADPPNDTYYYRQWNLDKVEAPRAWEITRGDSSMPIAVIDTGMDLSHPDLVDKLWVNRGELPGNGVDDDGNGYIDDVHGYDFVNGDGDPEDDHGHGTHVAGIAAAATDNRLGVAGMAPANPLMALKVLSSSGEGTYYDVAGAIDYALAQGARVMNLSLAGLDDSVVLHQAVQAAAAGGAIVVAAAGNCAGGCYIEGRDYVNPILYPAAYEEALAVGATDRDDGIAGFSEHHPYVDVVAPGTSIYSTYRGGSYAYSSGTSMATPHVSGLALLLWAADPTLTWEEVVEQIVENAEDLGAPGKDDYYGWGRINAHSALCTTIVAPSLLTFMADGHSLSVPLSRTVQITNRSCVPITWTATISPSSASWTHLAPVSGTLARGESQPLQVAVDPAELEEAYGDYTSQIQFSSACGTAEDVVDIHLHYVPWLRQLFLVPVPKRRTSGTAPSQADGPRGTQIKAGSTDW